MTREIHAIPPTPRAVRWRAVLWHWWPIAFLGFVLGVYGGLITLMLFLAKGGKQSDDLLIDAGSEVVMGTIEKLEGGPFGARSDEPIRLSYRYTDKTGANRPGRSFLHRPQGRVGERIPIEYAITRPLVSRAVGGRLSRVPPLHIFFLYLLWAPGLVCLTIWFSAVVRLRSLMKHGDVAVAEVVAIEPIRIVSPAMIRAVYRFRDHHAALKVASHWVRCRSALGQRLESNPKQIAVIHGRDGDGISRLVMADDFESPSLALALDRAKR